MSAIMTCPFCKHVYCVHCRSLAVRRRQAHQALLKQGHYPRPAGQTDTSVRPCMLSDVQLMEQILRGNVCKMITALF